MNQKNLISLIVFDLVVMLLTLGMFFFRYHSLTAPALPAAVPVLAETPQPVPEAESPAAHAPAKAPAAAPVPPASKAAAENTQQDEPLAYDTNAEEKRNIKFTYKNSKARTVEIIGDFNGWVPQPLKKGAKFQWTVTLSLAPGEYAYNFVANGKPVRDPNNTKICDAGRGFPNSYLKVKSLADERKKSE